jgi:hypothetical protein
MEVGDELLKSKNGNNVYKVLEIDNGKFVKLKCVWFGGKEDLGDLIFCTREGQEIWVTMYCVRHFEKIIL